MQIEMENQGKNEQPPELIESSSSGSNFMEQDDGESSCENNMNDSDGVIDMTGTGLTKK